MSRCGSFILAAGVICVACGAGVTKPTPVGVLPLHAGEHLLQISGADFVDDVGALAGGVLIGEVTFRNDAGTTVACNSGTAMWSLSRLLGPTEEGASR